MLFGFNVNALLPRYLKLVMVAPHFINLAQLTCLTLIIISLAYDVATFVFKRSNTDARMSLHHINFLLDSVDGSAIVSSYI